LIKFRIKTSQLKPTVMAWKSQMNAFVNDAYTNGLKYGALLTLESGTARGEEKPVIRYAGTQSATYNDIASAPVVLPAKKACGIIYESSPRDIYSSYVDLSNEERLFPYGRRQQDPIAIIDEAVYEITDLDDLMGNGYYFRSTDKVLVTAGQSNVVFDNTAKTITFSASVVTGFRVGEKLVTSSGAVAYIESITYGASSTVIELSAGLGALVVETKLVSTLFEPLYSAPDMNGELPFQLKPNGDIIGKVVSAIAAQIKIQ
jgi:hypothetical protein